MAVNLKNTFRICSDFLHLFSVAMRRLLPLDLVCSFVFDGVSLLYQNIIKLSKHKRLQPSYTGGLFYMGQEYNEVFYVWKIFI